MSDNYEYEKSTIPQSENEYSPYQDKQFGSQYINDLNSGVYANVNQSLVTIDVSQLYNSQKFTDLSDMFILVPVVLTFALSTSANNGTLVAPTAGTSSLLSLKSNSVNLIHQADFTINGKTIESTQPYTNVYKNFKMLSEMSINDQKAMGHTLLIGEDYIDNHRSAQYFKADATGSRAGQGVCNNRPFGATVAGSRIPLTQQTVQNTGTVNDAIGSRLARYVDTTSATYNNFYNNFYTATSLNNEYRPYYTVLNTNYGVYYDYVCIRVRDIFESAANLGLVKKADVIFRLYFNTGVVNVGVSGANTTSTLYSYSPSDSTFTGSCPLTVNYLNDTSANGGLPNTTANITAGFFIARAPATSIKGVNLGLSGASHPIQACRLYYSQIALQPEKAQEYLTLSRAKKVVYRTFLTNQYNNIQGTFNQLINSGITNPTGIYIVPYFSQANANSFGDFAPRSPFDTVPSTGHPISLINLQVSVGGQNILQSTLYGGYENFISQISMIDTIGSSDFGISNGLISQAWWEQNRFYYVNLSRSDKGDKLTARNINVSFTINVANSLTTSVPIDCLIFTEYADSFVVDVETGAVQK